MKINLFGNTIDTKDLEPPILGKVRRKIAHGLTSEKPWRYHPFELFPLDFEPLWYMDIGANQGDLASLALKSFPSCRAVCFEPVESTRVLLQKHLKPYETRTHIFPYALGSRDGVAEIRLTNFHGANSLIPQSQAHQNLNPHVRETGKTETIEIRTIDSLIESLPSKHFDIVKIDVEGFEPEVFRGGRNFFKTSVDWIFVEVAPIRDLTEGADSILFQVFHELNQLGFRLVNITDVSRTTTQFEQIAQMDCLFRKTK